MDLSRLREIVYLTLGADKDAFTVRDVDVALQIALNDKIRATRCSRVVRSKTVTAYDPVVDLSTISDFRSERLLRAEVGYNDRGAHADATAYAVNDLVAYSDRYYVCVAAHTSGVSTVPPSSTYWHLVRWKRGTPLEVVSDRDIAADFRGSRAQRIDPRREGGGSAGTEPGRPYRISFDLATQAYLWPVPDVAYPLQLLIWKPLERWAPGTSKSVTVDVPEEYAESCGLFGAPAVLLYPDPDQRLASEMWRQFQATHVADRAADNRRGVAYRDPDLML